MGQSLVSAYGLILTTAAPQLSSAPNSSTLSSSLINLKYQSKVHVLIDNFIKRQHIKHCTVLSKRISYEKSVCFMLATSPR